MHLLATDAFKRAGLLTRKVLDFLAQRRKRDINRFLTLKPNPVLSSCLCTVSKPQSLEGSYRQTFLLFQILVGLSGSPLNSSFGPVPNVKFVLQHKLFSNLTTQRSHLLFGSIKSNITNKSNILENKLQAKHGERSYKTLGPMFM